MRSVIIFTALTVLSCILLFATGYWLFTDTLEKGTGGPEKAKQAGQNCTGGIIAELDGIELLVPRDLTFQLAGAPQPLQDWGHPQTNCKLTRLTRLHRIENPGQWQIIAPQSGPAGQSQYYYLQHQIVAAVHDNAFVSLNNGVRVIRMDRGDIYLLPAEAAPTRSGKPVAIICEGGQAAGICTTAYTLGNGLYFTYRFSRSGEAADGYLGYDRQMREMLGSMVTAAQQTGQGR